MLFIPTGYGPWALKTTMSSLSLNSTSESNNLTVPKLQDNGSNWSDYKPRVKKGMGAKGLWRNIEGTATVPKLYTVVNVISVTSDGKTPATLLQRNRLSQRKLES